MIFRFSWPTGTTSFPIPPGLFQANYGPHGYELIRLEVPTDQSIKGMKGVKVTGDPNIPFDKITFEIDAPGCLDIPIEKQRKCRSLKKFLEDPRYLDFQVTCTKYAKIRWGVINIKQDDLVLDFAMPNDIRDTSGVEASSCQVTYDKRKFNFLILRVVGAANAN